MLPEGLGFLKPGWWMLHVLAVSLVFVWGYREGRDAERDEKKQAERLRRAAEKAAAAKSETVAPSRPPDPPPAR